MGTVASPGEITEARHHPMRCSTCEANRRRHPLGPCPPSLPGVAIGRIPSRARAKSCQPRPASVIVGWKASRTAETGCRKHDLPTKIFDHVSLRFFAPAYWRTHLPCLGTGFGGHGGRAGTSTKAEAGGTSPFGGSSRFPLGWQLPSYHARCCRKRVGWPHRAWVSAVPASPD